MSTVFVKQGRLGGYTSVPGGQSDPECTHVIMTKAEYSKLIRKYQLQIKQERDRHEDELQEKKKEYDELNAEHSKLIEDWNNLVNEWNNSIVISQEEYNGYQKALRIVKDRSLQQIDKSQADKHGYRLLRADKRVYDRKNGKYAYQITKSTPYSIKMDPQVVKNVIQEDLTLHYNYVGIRTYVDTRVEKQEKRITISKYCDGIVQKDDPQYESRDFYSSNDEEGRAIYQVFKEYDNVFIFEISTLSTNIAQGVYEITYWATDII